MSSIAYQGKYFALCADIHGTEFVAAREHEVLIVPLDASGEVILTSEPSPAFGGTALILPGGSVEASEGHAATAARELAEEIGLAAGRLDFLGELRPFSKYLTVRSFIYLARDLTPHALKGDEDYPIQQERVALATFEQTIASGQLVDARVIAALFMARSFLQRGP